MTNILKQLEPELVEMDRCIKVITARIKQFTPQTVKAQELYNNLATSMLTLNMYTMMIRMSLIALTVDEGTNDDES